MKNYVEIKDELISNVGRDLDFVFCDLIMRDEIVDEYVVCNENPPHSEAFTIAYLYLKSGYIMVLSTSKEGKYVSYEYVPLYGISLKQGCIFLVKSERAEYGNCLFNIGSVILFFKNANKKYRSSIKSLLSTSQPIL